MPHAFTMFQKLEANKIGVWCRRDASFFCKTKFACSGYQSPSVITSSPCPVRLRSCRLFPQRWHLVSTGRHFSKISSICRRRDDTRFFECAFGVDETLVGKCRFLTMCVLRRREAISQSEFPIVFPEITILVFRQMADPLPKRCVCCKRDVIFLKKQAFCVDETSLDFENVHLV